MPPMRWVATPDPTEIITRPSMAQAAIATMNPGPMAFLPVRTRPYCRKTSRGGAGARTTRVGMRSLDGGLGRTCAVLRSRIGMFSIVASLTAGLRRIARVHRNEADYS
jgi:hypothetical protein